MQKITHYLSTRGSEVCVCGGDEYSDKKGLGGGERGQRSRSCELHTGILQLRGARVWQGLDELGQALNIQHSSL